MVAGDKVNLERSIKASSEIGGHLMSGHIHCKGKVIETQVRENTKDMFIEISNKYSPYLIEKGYIGINGCSLTIGEVINNGFYIHLIPETLKITNISKLDLNDIVNIEIDQNTIAIVDTVNKVLLAQKSS
jgi:riboflavin synthase